MAKDLTASGLFKKLDDANREAEQVYKQALTASRDRLVRDLTSIAEDGLATFAGVTAAWMKKQSLAAVTGWILLAGLLLLLTIYASIRMLTLWTEKDIEGLIREKAALAGEVAAQKKTIERLEQKTWGVLLHEDKNGRFVVFPKADPELPATWRVGDRPAWKIKE